MVSQGSDTYQFQHEQERASSSVHSFMTAGLISKLEYANMNTEAGKSDFNERLQVSGALLMPWKVSELSYNSGPR